MTHKQYTCNPHIHHPSFYARLDETITVQEAAALTGHTERYIRFWCDAGWLAARKSGRVWLISRASLLQFIRYRLEVQVVHRQS